MAPCELLGHCLDYSIFLIYSLSWCKVLTHWKRPWCWEGLGAGGEEDNRGWDSWMASPTRWTWVWVTSGSWWWTGRPGVLQFMGSQRVGHDWATELNWTETLIDVLHSNSIVIYILLFSYATMKQKHFTKFTASCIWTSGSLYTLTIFILSLL